MQEQATELSNPVNVQMRLPVDVYRRLQEESEADMIPVSYLVRRCLIRYYSGDSFASEERTKRTSEAQTIQSDGSDSNEQEEAPARARPR